MSPDASGGGWRGYAGRRVAHRRDSRQLESRAVAVSKEQLVSGRALALLELSGYSKTVKGRGKGREQ